MNDGRGSTEFIPGYYTGKKDFSDVKELIEQASAKARTAEEQGSQNLLDITYSEDTPKGLGRVATSDLPTSPYAIQQSPEKNLSDMQRKIRDIKAIGLGLQQCRNRALGRGVDSNV